MQLPIATTATLVVVSYIIYLVLASFLQSRRNARKARELKCEEPPLQKNKYPLGIDQIQKALAADKEKLFPIEMAKRTVEVGAITYRYSVLGNNNIFTADEKNIQAILATQFSDFDLGPTRRGNFWPLLGNGIFTQDGAGCKSNASTLHHPHTRMNPYFECWMLLLARNVATTVSYLLTCAQGNIPGP